MRESKRLICGGLAKHPQDVAKLAHSSDDLAEASRRTHRCTSPSSRIMAATSSWTDGFPNEQVVAAISNPEIIIGTFGYLLLKPILRNSGLVNTKKGAYKTPMITYNVLMAVYSFACFFATCTALGWDRGYGAPLLAWAGDSPVALYGDACPSPVFSSKLFMLAAKSFYYSKYIEYLDTAWLVLKGKPVSFLQTFHHFGAPWDVYLGLVLRNEGLWIFMFLNAFIHTIMYSYYALTAAGVSYPAKPLITLMQARAHAPTRPHAHTPNARRACPTRTTTHTHTHTHLTRSMGACGLLSPPLADRAVPLGLHGGVAVQGRQMLPRQPRHDALVGVQLCLRRWSPPALHALLLPCAPAVSNL